MTSIDQPQQLSERDGYEDWSAAVIQAVEARHQAHTEPHCVDPRPRRWLLERAQLAVGLRLRPRRVRPRS